MLVKLKFTGFVFFVFIIFFSFSQTEKNNVQGDYALANQLFIDAEKFSTNDSKQVQQDELNRKALDIFQNIIAKKSNLLIDSQLLNCCFKAGIIAHNFDSVSLAKKYYLQTIAFKGKIKNIPDSFFFKPNLYAGAILYSQHEFDSALIFYKNAEQIANEYHSPLLEEERLYNGLGVMQYETGNFHSANNYFEKAISLLQKNSPFYANMLVNYKMNIASQLIKVEEFTKADTILKSILQYGILSNEINQNLGIIHLKLNKTKEAILYFRKVNYEGKKKQIELFYNLAIAFNDLKQSDSVNYYSNKALEINELFNKDKKSNSAGLIYKFLGDNYLTNNKSDSALIFYQKAINQFYPNFNDEKITSIPDKFSGVFSYINLFHALIAKGDAFKKNNELKEDLTQLKASLQSYQSAFNLLDYVSRSYDSEEARFFLNKIKYSAYEKAIQVALELYKITGIKSFLETAYNFDQRSKASVLSVSLQENEMKKMADLPETLTQQQSSLRTSITRLSIKATHSTDSLELANINNQIRDAEIGLSNIQQKINENPKYASLNPVVHVPSVENLHEMLDSKTSLISYHISANSISTFLISKNNFENFNLIIDSTFINEIKSFVYQIHNTNQSEKYEGNNGAKKLFQILVKPILKKLKGIKRLIIIPDNELNYLPFEALQDENNNYLIHSYSIQYQFTTAILKQNDNKYDEDKSAGFAPFTKENKNTFFQTLPNSKEEILEMKGKHYFDEEATKSNFINQANRFNTIQLATHAQANDSLPAKSFIAFYPTQKDSADEQKLYAQEIYNLRLDSTQLIILSACETGTGQLVRGEGLMSLTRAFAYSGCPNIVTSLWKAADKSTSYLTKRFHFYLNKKETYDEALQHAKIDFLNDQAISPALKTPNYWSHLIFIGNYQSNHSSYLIYLFGVFILLISLVYVIIKKPRK